MARKHKPQIPEPERELDDPSESFSPTSAADYAEDREMVALFREIPEEVSYRDFHDKMPVESFLRVRRLATYDLWTDADDNKKLSWLQASKLTKVNSPDAGFLEGLRKNPRYQEMVDALLAAMEKLCQVRSFRDHIEDERFQDRMVRRLKQISLHSLDHRAATKAIDTLVERISPRALPGQQQTVIMLPEAYLERIALVDRQVKEIEGGTVGEYPQIHEVEDDGASGEGET